MPTEDKTYKSDEVFLVVFPLLRDCRLMFSI